MELTVDQALQKAISAHQSGDLQAAEGLYTAILATQPNHGDANHNLGLLTLGAGQPDKALTFLKAALQVNPQQDQYWISYIHALIEANLLIEAQAALKEAKSLVLSATQRMLIEQKLQEIKLNQKKIKKEKNNGELLFNASKNKATQNGPASPSKQEINALFSHYSSGQFDLVKISAELLIKEYPKHPFAWKILGVVLMEIGQPEEALITMQQVILLDQKDPEGFNNLGVLLKKLGRYSEAETSCRQAISLKPDFAEANSNLGYILINSDRLEEAVVSLQRALEIKPENIEILCNLGNTLSELGRLEEAVASYRRALEIKPDYADAHNNLGKNLNDLDRLEEAEASYRLALEINPDFEIAHSNLGNTLSKLGRLEEAEASYRRALEINPDFEMAHRNLAITLKELGRLEEALNAVIKLIKIKSTVEAKFVFIEVIGNLDPNAWDQVLAHLLITAFLESWDGHKNLIPFACRLLKINEEFTQTLNQLKNDASQVNFDKIFISSISKKEFIASSLLQAMLCSNLIPDPELEIFLANLRFHLLKKASLIMLKEDEADEVAILYTSLAKQCFINEYVYFQTPEEIDLSLELRKQLMKSLETEQNIPAFWVIAVACYFPLYLVAGAKKLLQKKWPDELKSVLIQQIQEPLEEFNLRRSIPNLTNIENQVSLAVQSQYEENPYPRWVRLPKESSKKFLNSYLQSKFPLSDFSPIVGDRNPQILIAGSGTGNHPIQTSQLIKGAKILAIDLSMTSLAYAKRKTLELGIDSIEYAQADLLKLTSLDLTFDVIESSGVLHHLENPFEGWKVLLSLLRTNGLMKLGFYSELARRDIVRVRNLIGKEGIGSSSKEIRDFRKYLHGLKNSEDYGFAVNSLDFFSTSTCRDLLFHIQEHRMNLKVLDSFIKEHNLNFLGFEPYGSMLRTYKNRFQNDPSATNLNQWHIYEEENPDTFLSMYQFWIQKKH
jgi:tetratricopeptide (TPR) repeat protein/2-polyprenyl-3-methyl-5-hydroxy-6-metoxy-1,4-benzoquinol methylase